MYPSELQYKHSVENKMYPPANGGYRFLPSINENNEVIFSSGGRAVVFKVNEESTGKATALKFFTVEDQNRFQHYLEISNYLKNIKSNFLVSFQIIENLIYVEFDNENPDNNYFPGLVMDWASGVTLQSKLKELCEKDEKNKIAKLKANFKKLAFFLLSENIAHGDLKHDNIIVNDDLDLVLVDYDGIFIPTFNGSQSSELGTSSFQHPQRKNTDFNQRIDDFSILTIYTSLVAFENNPALFNKYYDEQNLLFSLEDFLKPKKSELFKTLSNQNETKALAFYIKQSLASQSIYIDNLKDLLNGKFPKPSIEISHSPTTALIGQKVKISWKSNDVDFVKINGTEQNVSGTIEELAKKDHRLDFEFGNEIDLKKASYKFKSIPEPKIKEFKVKQQKIEFGKKTQLVWNVDNAEKVELYYAGNIELLPNKGEKTISLDADTNYKLKVTALDGVFIKEKKINVQVFKNIKINEFKPDYDIVYENHYVNLKWEIENASHISIKSSNKMFNENVTDKSNISFKLKEDTIFYLEAKNDLFNDEKKIEVHVERAPRIPPLPVFPSGKELIPVFNLDFSLNIDNFLSDSQISFQKATKKNKRFSLIETLKTILKK